MLVQKIFVSSKELFRRTIYRSRVALEISPDPLRSESEPLLKISVADPDPGSGAFLTPKSEIRNRFFPDPGSRIPDPRSQTNNFDYLVTTFWVKFSIIL